MNQDLSFVNKPTDFYKYVKHVIEWNKIAGDGKHDFSHTKIAAQKRFVKEEFDELIDKGIKRGNKIEVIDGLADLVVTVGYWMYLRDPHLIENSCKLIHYGMGNNYIKLLENDIINDRPWEAMQSVMALCHQVDFKVDATIREVLRSNDSKIPTLQEFTDKHYNTTRIGGLDLDSMLLLECRMIEESSNGRYEGVTYQLCGDHVVFREKGSKIVKPSLFSEANLEGFI